MGTHAVSAWLCLSLLRRRCCFFGHSPEEVAAESKVLRDHPVLGRDVAATASLDELAERVTRLERVVEQIAVDGLQHVPQERVQNSVGEQIGAVPALQIWEPIEGPHVVPQERVQNRMPDQERVQNRTPEQILDVLVRQITEDGLPVVPQERVQNRVAEQIVGIPVPQLMEAVVEVTPQECVQKCTLEKIVDVLLPQIVEERVRLCTQEQIVDVLVPQIVEEIVERLVDVGAPVPQITEDILDSVPLEDVGSVVPLSNALIPHVTEFADEVRDIPLQRIWCIFEEDGSAFCGTDCGRACAARHGDHWECAGK